MKAKTYIDRANKIHNNKYKYLDLPEDFDITKQIITCECPIHGQFIVKASKHIYRNQGCKICSNILQSERHKDTIEDFIEKARKAHGNKYDYDKTEYIKSTIKVLITCPNHGDFIQNPGDHINGHGCKKCYLDKPSAIKLTQEQFVERSNLIHNFKYDYSNSIYTLSNDKINIICPFHGSFLQNAYSHMNGFGCSKCGHEQGAKKLSRTTNDLLKYGREIYGDLYDLSKININSSKDIFILNCKTHGDFETTYNRLINSQQSCPKCGDENSIRKRTKTTEQFIFQAKLIHKNKYSYDKSIYISAIKDIIITCNKHGDFITTPNRHLTNTGGCCLKCAYMYSPTTEEYVEEAKIKHNNFYSYEETIYINSNTKIKVRCPKHGIFLTKPGGHLHEGYGCIKCCHFISKGETEWLNYLNIPQVYRQTIFYNNNRKYIVDAYNPNTNTIYEYLGNYWHGNPNLYNSFDYNKRMEKTHGELYFDTMVRLEELEKQGYNIIYIWELDWKILKKQLQIK